MHDMSVAACSFVEAQVIIIEHEGADEWVYVFHLCDGDKFPMNMIYDSTATHFIWLIRQGQHDVRNSTEKRDVFVKKEENRDQAEASSPEKPDFILERQYVVVVDNDWNFRMGANAECIITGTYQKLLDVVLYPSTLKLKS